LGLHSNRAHVIATIWEAPGSQWYL